MKKILIISLLLLSIFMFNSNVKADTVIVPQNFSDSENLYSAEKIEQLLSYYNDNLSSNFKYYYIRSSNMFVFNDYTEFNSSTGFYFGTTSYKDYLALSFDNVSIYQISNDNISLVSTNSLFYMPLFGWNSLEDVSDFYLPHATNLLFNLSFFKMFNDSNVFDEIDISSVYDDNIILTENTNIPSIYNLYKYDSWSDYETNNSLSDYTTVNLDDYYYVILNLKDYNHEDAFSSNLKVKGMIGITPIYNFGTSEKLQITDRCNLSYSDYTDYRLYILSSDLLNKSVYAIKACEDNSSFKFDNTVFDITYVTDDNVDDPVIKINGQDYHTIPFDKLSNTANKNEENNFVPGESTNFLDNMTDVFDSPLELLKNVAGSISSFFNLIVTCVGYLPTTLQVFLYLAFVLAIVLGILKIIL